MYTEDDAPVSIATNLTLTDLDGSPDYTDIVTVTITELADEDQEMLYFDNTTTNITVVQTVFPTSDNGFTAVYELRNGTTYGEYNQVCNHVL